MNPSELPKASDYVNKWKSRTSRQDELLEEMSQLKPFQLKSADQLLATGIELKHTRLRVLATRKEVDERHGKNTLSYRYDEARVLNEITEYDTLRDLIYQVFRGQSSPETVSDKAEASPQEPDDISQSTE